MNQSKGFSLIELLVALAVVGVLAAIAVPQFAGHLGNAFDKRAQISLKHVAIAEEALFVDTESFVDCNQDTCPALLPELGPISSGVVLQITATPTGFTGTASHPQGTGIVYTWNY